MQPCIKKKLKDESMAACTTTCRHQTEPADETRLGRGGLLKKETSENKAAAMKHLSSLTTTPQTWGSALLPLPISSFFTVFLHLSAAI